MAAADELGTEVVVTAALVVVAMLVALLVLKLELVLLADELGLDEEELVTVVEPLPFDVDFVVTVLMVVCDEEMEDVVPRWIELDGEAEVVG